MADRSDVLRDVPARCGGFGLVDRFRETAHSYGGMGADIASDDRDVLWRALGSGAGGRVFFSRIGPAVDHRVAEERMGRIDRGIGHLWSGAFVVPRISEL